MDPSPGAHAVLSAGHTTNRPDTRPVRGTPVPAPHPTITATAPTTNTTGRTLRTLVRQSLIAADYSRAYGRSRSASGLVMAARRRSSGGTLRLTIDDLDPSCFGGVASAESPPGDVTPQRTRRRHSRWLLARDR